MKQKFNDIKNFLKSAKLYFILPHVWVLMVIILLDVGMLCLSVTYMERDSFLSSIYANIFAGLLTGVVICLISTIKAISLYRTEYIIAWLEDLHKDCLKFMEMHHKVHFPKKGAFESDDQYHEFVYDTLCCGNEISNKISQSQFMQTLPFNPYKYFRKEFSFDAVKELENNYKIRNSIINGDITLESPKVAFELLEPLERQVRDLNKKMLKKIDFLKIKQKATKMSIG